MKSEILYADFPKPRKKLCEKFTDLSITNCAEFFKTLTEKCAKKLKINLQKFHWILKIVLDVYKFALNGVNKFCVNYFPKFVNEILKIFAISCVQKLSCLIFNSLT